MHGISINTRFIRFLSYMFHPTKSMASVGLAQAHPNYLHTHVATYACRRVIVTHTCVAPAVLKPRKKQCQLSYQFYVKN